jgi:hypothetical protein
MSTTHGIITQKTVVFILAAVRTWNPTINTFLSFCTTLFNHNAKLLTHERDSAVLQEVSRRQLTAETRVRARFSPCGICGGLSSTGTGFSPSFRFPSSMSANIIPPWLSILTYHQRSEQHARWWPQFRETASLHRHEQRMRDVLSKETSGTARSCTKRRGTLHSRP